MYFEETTLLACIVSFRFKAVAELENVGAHPLLALLLWWSAYGKAARVFGMVATLAPGTRSGMENTSTWRKPSAFRWISVMFCWNPSTWSCHSCFCSASMEQVEGLLFGSWISTSFLKILLRGRLCGLWANFAMPSPFITCASSLGASCAAIWVMWCFWGSGFPVWHRNYDAEIRHTSHLRRENWWLIPARLPVETFHGKQTFLYSISQLLEPCLTLTSFNLKWYLYTVILFCKSRALAIWLHCLCIWCCFQCACCRGREHYLRRRWHLVFHSPSRSWGRDVTEPCPGYWDISVHIPHEVTHCQSMKVC